MQNPTRRSALITGASSGIGLATARALARKGFDCILIARSAERLETIATELQREFGGTHTAAPGDVTTSDAFISGIRPIVDERRPDIAIVNAGIGQYGPVWRSSWSDVSAVLHTNIDGALATVHAVLPGMIERKRGSIVLISSVLGKRALPYNAAYCASKFALHGYADALRLEAKAHGVHVGVVCPARTDTPFFSAMTYSVPQGKRRQVPTSPPERVAEAILRCAFSRRREVVVSAEARLMAFAGVHFPRLMDFVLFRMVPRPEET